MNWTLIILAVAAAYGLLIGMITVMCITGKKEGRTQEKEPADYLDKAVFYHLFGLPLGEKAASTIYFLKDQIAISGEGKTILLPFEDVEDVAVQTWEKMQELIQKHKLDVGGKKDFSFKLGKVQSLKWKAKSGLSYFTITYRRGSKAAFAVFQVIGSASKATQMAKLFRNLHWEPAPVG